MQTLTDSLQTAISQKLLYWERIQGISAIVVAALATTGLLSYFLAKRGLVSSEKRAKVQDAVERCEEMREEIIPNLEKLTLVFAAAKTKMFESNSGKVQFPAEIDEAKAEKALVWVKALPNECRQLALQILNQLETWAIHFNRDLADSDVAYKPCATIYCTIVVLLYPAIIVQRHNDPTSGPYQNTIDLFAKWYKEQRMEKIQNEVSKLQIDGVFKSPAK